MLWPCFEPWPPRCWGSEALEFLRRDDLPTCLIIKNRPTYQTTCQTINIAVNQLIVLYTSHSFNKRTTCQDLTNRITKQCTNQLIRQPSNFSTCYAFSKPRNHTVYQVIIHPMNKLNQCAVGAACKTDTSFPAFRSVSIYSADGREFELHYPYHPRYFFLLAHYSVFYKVQFYKTIRENRTFLEVSVHVYIRPKRFCGQRQRNWKLVINRKWKIN